MCPLYYYIFSDFDDSLARVYLPPLSASAVLYDARIVHQQWVSSDHSFFSSYLENALKKIKKDEEQGWRKIFEKIK